MMLIRLNEKFREIHVLGCGDCPFTENSTYGGLTCSIVVQEHGPDVAEIDIDERCPSWCPLRGGAISVSAEPYALDRTPD